MNNRKLQVGDKVRIMKFPTGAFIGDYGTVIDIDENLSHPIRVDLSPKYKVKPNFRRIELMLVETREQALVVAEGE